MPNLFPQPSPPPQAQQDWTQPPNYYARPTPQVNQDAFPWRAIIYSALALLLFFVLHGIGIIFAGYGVYYAFSLRGEGNKWAGLAIGVSVLSLIAILIGYYIRFTSGQG